MGSCPPQWEGYHAPTGRSVTDFTLVRRRKGLLLLLRVRAAEGGRVSRVSSVQTAMRNCTRDEGGPFEIGNQVLISSHRKLLSSKAMVVSVAESTGQDPVRQG